MAETTKIVAMLPRRLKGIAQIPQSERFAVLSAGLLALADSVEALNADRLLLSEGGRHQAAAVLRALSEEEAAKVLIIVDLARAGWQDQEPLKRSLSRFYDHLARGLYVEAYNGSPASLGEVRKYVDFGRQEFYLDGPMDVDWVFGNPITTEREQRLYVDYIEEEDGSRRWVTPQDVVRDRDEALAFVEPTAVAIEVVLAMARLGLLTVTGLEAARQVWDGVKLDDDTHWTVVRSLNQSVLERLYTPDWESDPLLVESARYLVEHWSFPMVGLDLSLMKVDRSDLEAKRQVWLFREAGY